MKKFLLFILLTSLGFSASWVWLWNGNKMGLSPDSFVTDVPLLFIPTRTGGVDTTVVKSDSVKISGYLYIYNGTKSIWGLGDSLVLYNSADGQDPSKICFGGTYGTNSVRWSIGMDNENDPLLNFGVYDQCGTTYNKVAVTMSPTALLPGVSNDMYLGGTGNIWKGEYVYFVVATDSVSAKYGRFSKKVSAESLTATNLIYIKTNNTSMPAGYFAGYAGGSASYLWREGAVGPTVAMFGVVGNSSTSEKSTIDSTGKYEITSGAILRKKAVVVDSVIGTYYSNLPSAAMTKEAIMDTLARGIGTYPPHGAGLFAGDTNRIESGTHTVIVGGYADTISVQGGTPNYSGILSGRHSHVGSDYSANIGGKDIKNFGSFSAFAAGEGHVNYGDHCFIAGGYGDTISTSNAAYVAIVGGYGCKAIANADYSFLGGGESNIINTNSIKSVILGGDYDSIGTGNAGNRNIILNGTRNRIDGAIRSGIVAGGNNRIYSTNAPASNVILGASNSIIRGVSADSCNVAMGVGAIVDSCMGSVALNTRIRQRDSTLGVSKRIMVCGGNDTTWVEAAGLTTRYVVTSDSVRSKKLYVETELNHPQEVPTVKQWNAMDYFIQSSYLPIAVYPELGYVRNAVEDWTGGALSFLFGCPIDQKGVGGTVIIDSLLIYIQIDDTNIDAKLDSVMLQRMNMTSGYTWSTVKSWTTGTNTPGYQAVNMITGGDYTVVDGYCYRIKASTYTNDGDLDAKIRILGFKMVSHLE